MAMATAMGSTAKVMGQMNQAMKLEDVHTTMQQFEKESTKMEMADELSMYLLFPLRVRSLWLEGVIDK